MTEILRYSFSYDHISHIEQILCLIVHCKNAVLAALLFYWQQYNREYDTVHLLLFVHACILKLRLSTLLKRYFESIAFALV